LSRNLPRFWPGGHFIHKTFFPRPEKGRIPTPNRQRYHGLFWIDEAKELDVGFEAAEGKQKVMGPSEKEMLNFLAGQGLPKDKEIYLRMRCWWNANDAWRHVPNPKPAFSPEQVKNLEALSAFFDESLPGHRILKAEIARELGRFDECLLLLSYQFEPDYDWTVGFIKKLAEGKVRAVKLFDRGK
jgi:hypothetical protein